MVPPPRRPPRDGGDGPRIGGVQRSRPVGGYRHDPATATLHRPMGRRSPAL